MLYSGKIIDAHCHPFLLPEGNIAPYGDPVDTEGFFAEMRRMGFSACCGSVLVLKKEKTSFEDIHNANIHALKLRDLSNGFYIPGIQVHGEYAEESCREVEEMYYKEGIRWIGELVEYAMHTGAYDSPGMYRIYETAQALDMTVNIHCSDLTLVENVLKNFPRMKTVLAHPEDMRTCRQRIELLSRYPNGYLDISGTGIFRYGMLRYALDRMGADRVLFGTDFPVCAPGVYVGGVLGEHLSDDEREKIFYKNFESLTGLCI